MAKKTTKKTTKKPIRSQRAMTAAELAAKTFQGGTAAVRALEQKRNKTERERQALGTIDAWMAQ